MVTSLLLLFCISIKSITIHQCTVTTLLSNNTITHNIYTHHTKTMKFLFSALFLSQAVAFAPLPNKPAALQSCLFAEGRINTSVDLDSPKVATIDDIAKGSKKVYCRCWQSGTFPLCDGQHMKHNEATGDNVGPLIVSAAKEE